MLEVPPLPGVTDVTARELERAAALLYNTFARCRQEARLHYVVSFKRKIEQFDCVLDDYR